MRFRRTVRTGKLNLQSAARGRWVASRALVLVATLLAACTLIPPKSSGIGNSVPWSKLPGWEQDRPAEAWPALLNSCAQLANRDPLWHTLCQDAGLFSRPDDATARAFFETRFVPHELVNTDGGYEGLITGYYEPLLRGNIVKTARYRYPIYRTPPDLLVVDLAELYPELQGKTIRGRLRNRRVVPYFNRAEINQGENPLAGNEIVWVDDPVALFFLQIQGSGRVQLPDGRTLFVGYADQNGHPYVAIGRTLVQMGALKPDDVSLQSMRDWLRANPDNAVAVLNSNPSYVFFTVRDTKLPGPVGSLNVPLTAERSVAVDPRFVPLGLPVWVDTTLPTTDETVHSYRQMMFAQDTGGAINGAVRADVFFGFGTQAEWFAGRMKQPGRLYVLLPSKRNFSVAD